MLDEFEYKGQSISVTIEQLLLNCYSSTSLNQAGIVVNAVV